jgi:hypothetical protein
MKKCWWVVRPRLEALPAIEPTLKVAAREGASAKGYGRISGDARNAGGRDHAFGDRQKWVGRAWLAKNFEGESLIILVREEGTSSGGGAKGGRGDSTLSRAIHKENAISSIYNIWLSGLSCFLHSSSGQEDYE